MQTILLMDLDREVASHGGGLPASLQSIAHESETGEQRHIRACVACHKKMSAVNCTCLGLTMRSREEGEVQISAVQSSVQEVSHNGLNTNCGACHVMSVTVLCELDCVSAELVWQKTVLTQPASPLCHQACSRCAGSITHTYSFKDSERFD